MMKEVEKEKVMIYNVFPMKNDIIMKSIKLDTITLVHLLMTKKQGNKTDYLLEGNLKKYENKILSIFSFAVSYTLSKNLSLLIFSILFVSGFNFDIYLPSNDVLQKL